MRSLLLSLFTLLLLTACNETLDLNAEWSDQTIVYGILNQADTAQYIRITKTFLGQGDAYQMANESDSIQYSKDLDVRLLEYKMKEQNEGATPYNQSNWERTNRSDIILFKTNEIARDKDDTSEFYNTQNNYLYKTTEKLESLYKYKLEINVPGKSEVVSAETMLIGPVYVEQPYVNINGIVNSPIRLENYDNPATTKWESSMYGKIYEFVLRFWYYDIAYNDTMLQYVDLSYETLYVDNVPLPNENFTEKMSQEYGGFNFFKRIGNAIIEKPNIKRKAIGLDFIYYVGDSELNIYLSASANNNYATDNIYSNITNGTGIFAARYKHIVPNKTISNTSIDSLAKGFYTKQLNFANQNGVWK